MSTDAGALETRWEWLLGVEVLILWGKSVVLDSERIFPEPFLISC